MLVLMGILFVIGYILISIEHSIKINKGATALLLSVFLWTIYIFIAHATVPLYFSEEFSNYLAQNPTLKGVDLKKQILDYVIDVQLLSHVGDIGEIIFFLLGAMTVVEIVDMHQGFSLITDRITTRNKRKLLGLLMLITFFLSAVIDNMTTAIVMVSLLNKLIPDKKERWIYASIAILAANAGGAWSPIGDVTTILLWVTGTITPVPLIKYLFLPSVVSVLVPLIWVGRSLKGEIAPIKGVSKETCNLSVPYHHRLLILMLGIGGLLFVPVFKSITHLPPFTGVFLAVGVLWVVTDRMYRNISSDEPFHLKFCSLIRRIDVPTLLFFTGILLAVGALQSSGALLLASRALEENFNNVYIINVLLGLLSAVIDNVPLVAAALGLYPIANPATLATLSDATFMSNFVPDGVYWHFLAYCAGVGGSLLIIGSAAGVVVMGMEKITFTWYLKKISLAALVGYLAGALVYYLEVQLFGAIV
ncbi:MAG: SLC13 family permease [Bacteroidales bacterium]